MREEPDLPGRLIIVEGVDGSGKSTQLDLLSKWLLGQGCVVVFSEWNSSPIVKSTTSRGKKRHILSPVSFSLIHAADFADRIHAQILPALRAGAVVVADRYVYTAFARDAVRGLDPDWLRTLYSFAVEPTLAFYFDVPLGEAVRRITTGRPAFKYYEAGMDLNLSLDPAESFRIYQGLIQTQYEKLVEEFGLIRMDGSQNLIRQQQLMRDLVRPHLDGVLRFDTAAVSEVLHEEGLLGRYLQLQGKPIPGTTP